MGLKQEEDKVAEGGGCRVRVQEVSPPDQGPVMLTRSAAREAQVFLTLQDRYVQFSENVSLVTNRTDH